MIDSQSPRNFPKLSYGFFLNPNQFFLPQVPVAGTSSSESLGGVEPSSLIGYPGLLENAMESSSAKVAGKKYKWRKQDSLSTMIFFRIAQHETCTGFPRSMGKGFIPFRKTGLPPPVVSILLFK